MKFYIGEFFEELSISSNFPEHRIKISNNLHEDPNNYVNFLSSVA
jgi:hypothetical protein